MSDRNLGKKVGKYSLVKYLGSGQFGDVYRGEVAGSEQVFAVKIIQKAKINSPILKDMLKSEVSIMQKMNHPNIIHLYDFMESSSNYYLAMQVCNNGDMTKYMEKMGKKFWSEEEAIFYVKQVASGFRELHRHKVMHRDFKLDNLFMHEDTVVIADLGFARAGREMTQTQCGTPMYQAPEVSDGKKYTNAADLWSVGVSFYQLLFGTFPFNGNTMHQLQQAVKTKSGSNLYIPRHVNPISKECEELLRSILTCDVSRRITWGGFFQHPLFREKAQPQGKVKLGNALNSMVAGSSIAVNNRFKADMDDNMDDFTLHNADKYGHSDNLATVGEEDRMDEHSWENKQKQVSQEAIYQENKERYWHERNKILFMFTTVRKLRDFFKRLHPQNPVKLSIVFFNVVLAQKALIYLTLNVNSVKNGMNIFKLQEFEGWLKSSYAREIGTQFEKDLAALEDYFAYMRNDERGLAYSEYDNNVLRTLNGKTELAMLDQIMDHKVRDMVGIRNDYNVTGNPELEGQWLNALYHADNAVRGEKVFLYKAGHPFNWTDFYNKLGHGDVAQLRSWVQSL